MKWILLLAFLAVTSSVDRGNFKTCDQSGFCKRQRNYQPESSPYKVLLESAKNDGDGTITFELLNTRSKVKFLLQFFALKNNMARLKITEADPSIPRYEPPVGDALLVEPERDSIVISEKSESRLTLTSQGNQVVVQSEPFRIDFIVGGDPVITVNARGLLKFEHTRVKEPEAAPEEGGEENPPAVNEEEPDKQEEEIDENQAEEPDLWEETFKTHKDSKPHGPQSVGMDISFPGFEFVYGIPEHADTLALKSTKNTNPYRLYNLDVFEYELNNPMALYGSVPLMYAHNEKRTVGIFWLNAAETWVDIGSNVADKGTFSKLVDFVKGDSDIPQIDTHWFSETGIIDVFFMLGPKPKDAFSQYAKLTGTTPLPPYFSLAYHQSRWNYNDEQDVASVDANFDAYDIPCDVIWLDIEHTDGKRYFTWDRQKFPNPEDMVKNVSSKGRKMVTIIDPHIKKDTNYHMYKQIQELGYFIKNKDGGDFEGWCWPGSSGWPDFLDPKIRQFWAEKFQLNEYPGSTLDLYTWNDMNEPSVFTGPEITMHKDAKHYGGFEHRDVHNIYGLYVHRATFEGHLQRSNNERRPFVLTRAFFAGSQNYGAVWTGDNTGEWGHLKISLPMVMTLNLAGITFSGADVGGFFKNPDHELLTRWYQAAAYQPFFRAHAHHDTRRREPWLLPEHHMTSIRNTIRTRYALLPFWYTLFYESEKSGMPLMNPLWVDFPTVKETFDIEDQHLVGDALLVHPVTDQGASGVNVYLPGQNEYWYDVDTFQRYTGGQKIYVPVDLNKIPVYQRGGTIIPRKQRIRRSSTLSYDDPYTLTVALDVKERATGTLYIDDYDSYNYRKGQFAYRQFNFENKILTNVNLHSESSGFQTRSWLERVTILGLTSQPSQVQLTGQGFDTRKLEFNFDASAKMLTIRKPGVNINVDWTISIQ